MTFPLIHLSGSPFQQGTEHGRALQQRIAHNLDLYFDRFQREAGLSREEVLQRALRYGPAIAAQNADYYAGVEGIAAGSGFSLAEILALNVRYEILYYSQVTAAQEKGLVDGCTSFAVAPTASDNGHLLLGQNWDWIPGVQGAMLHTLEEDGLQTLSFTEAGIYGGKIGLNSVGLGLVINGITTMNDDWSKLYKPFHVRCYEILRCRQIEEAVQVVTGSERGCSANFLIAQTPDMAVNLEAAPGVVHTLVWENGRLVHTNHFIDPEAIGITEPDEEVRFNSCRRRDRMEELMAAHRPLDIPTLQNLLQDHANAPKSICRHERPEDPIDEQYRTITAVVMDLEERTLYLTDGPPCKNGFERLAL